jgi:hypothetical protein
MCKFKSCSHVELAPSIAFGRSWLFPDQTAIAEASKTRADLAGSKVRASSAQLTSTCTDESAMIRSNPTAIPLRASDVKLLQAELDKRKNGSAVSPAATTPAPAGSSTLPVPTQAYNAVDAARQERQQKPRNERIGL